MLKYLRIQNIVLVESAEIPFGPGLNVISGETGSGKSAIMGALSLITGARADASLLRRNSEKGSVEALFDIGNLPHVAKLLEESGFEIEENEVILKREIQANGKSRAYINHQLAQISMLKKLGHLLVDLCGQHANQRLLDLDQHRLILDVYGNLTEDQRLFSLQWDKEIKARKELDQMILGEAKRIREIEVCKMEIEEIESAQLQEGEEEELFSEYSLLTNAEERIQNIQQITSALETLAILNPQQTTLHKLSEVDPTLEDSAKAYESALLELQEINRTLLNYQSHIEINPRRAQEINERLTLISRLKRKYGTTVEEILSYLEKAENQLQELENQDLTIETLQKEINVLHIENQKRSEKLTLDRKASAQKLEATLVKELRSLNMPKVEFSAQITNQQTNAYGSDRIEFFLTPNVGESQVSVRECASGGELSRLMLALQTLLAGKEQTPTLIFDEIDANIGGKTAVTVGNKLKEIGINHQVLCITHFPQVAKQAETHLQIAKKEVDGRTITCIQLLDAKERKAELARMQGE